MKRFLVLTLALGLVMGCSHGEASDCSKYVSQLEQMTPDKDDPRALFERISEQKCQDAVPYLARWFEASGGIYGGEVMRLVNAIWNPDRKSFEEQATKFTAVRGDYVSLLRVVLKNPEYALLASDLAGREGIADLKEDLIALLNEVTVKDSKPQFERAYGRAMTALGVFTSDAEAEEYKGLDAVNDLSDELLVALLTRTSDRQDIDANKKAAVALGKKKTDNPEAIKALIRGLFIANGAARTESIEALLRIGLPAVPYLLDIMMSKPGDEKVRYMEEFAVTNSLDEWKWREGIWVRMLLAQLWDERAAIAFIQDLGSPVIAPVGMPKDLEEEWHRTQGNRFKFDSWGLMSTMNAGAAQAALRVLRTESVDIQARLNLALGMAFNFSPESTEMLFQAVYNPTADAADDEEEEVKSDMPGPAFRADFVVPFMEPLCYAVRYSDLERFQEVFVDGFEEYFGDQDKPELIQEKLEDIDVGVLLGVPRHCQNDLDCYLKIVEGAVPPEVFDPEKAEEKYEGKLDQRARDYFAAMARTKAALVVSRWPTGRVEERQQVLERLFKVLRENLFESAELDDGTYEDFRRALMLSLERYARLSTRIKATVVPELQAMIKEGDPIAEKYEQIRPWVQRLESLVLFLERYNPEAEREKADQPADKDAKAAETAPPAVDGGEEAPAAE